MIYYVYMLKSKSVKPVTYVGYTNNIVKRISLHNSGKGAKFTRGRKWELIFKKKYENKSRAMKAENILKKNFKFRNLLKLKYIKNKENEKY